LFSKESFFESWFLSLLSSDFHFQVLFSLSLSVFSLFLATSATPSISGFPSHPGHEIYVTLVTYRCRPQKVATGDFAALDNYMRLWRILQADKPLFGELVHQLQGGSNVASSSAADMSMEPSSEIIYDPNTSTWTKADDNNDGGDEGDDCDDEDDDRGDEDDDSDDEADKEDVTVEDPGILLPAPDTPSSLTARLPEPALDCIPVECPEKQRNSINPPSIQASTTVSSESPRS
jgi:hypothetical protein